MSKKILLISFAFILIFAFSFGLSINKAEAKWVYYADGCKNYDPGKGNTLDCVSWHIKGKWVAGINIEANEPSGLVATLLPRSIENHVLQWNNDPEKITTVENTRSFLQTAFIALGEELSKSDHGVFAGTGITSLSDFINSEELPYRSIKYQRGGVTLFNLDARNPSNNDLAISSWTLETEPLELRNLSELRIEEVLGENKVLNLPLSTIQSLNLRDLPTVRPIH